MLGNQSQKIEIKILVIAPSIPKPDCNSGDRRFFALLELLAKHCSVDLWLASAPSSSPENVRYVEDVSRLQVKVLSDIAVINTVFSQAYYDAIFFEFYIIAEAFIDLCRLYQPHAKVIIDSVDVSFAREQIEAKLGLIESEQAEKTKQRELKIYKKSDVVIAVSHQDRRILYAENKNFKIIVIPNIIKLKQQSINPSSKEVIFIGGYNWSPNVDGIQWFVKEIWSLIIDMVPDAVLSIIGSNPTEEVLKLGEVSGVDVIGFVPDTNPYLKRAAVSIAPLRYGGGMKGKVNEAMSIGLPVVTTNVGAQGLNAISGKHLLIADEPKDFAEAVIGLLKNPDYRTEIGLAGQQLTADLCSPEVVEKVIVELIDSQIPPKKSLLPLFTRVRRTLTLFLFEKLGFIYLWNFGKRVNRKVMSLVAR
ncbi:glycosyltransferase [Chamaesiphon minutus]|uniref:Glycosyltransferase n=1 Tax=Chamaesiphon minutus (strain ATCC 27169 / PCC 6605) TaxID=1173020 RepID=K9UKH2_CHAP6|nr:glycosyltransferase [Chamaesiphon minutus]AFY95602.1 glycosyltransferase [Chamaesiphon minutus PCC 6605]